MIQSITYARLYNLGNYENEKFEVTVSVEDNDVASAFATAIDTVEAEHTHMANERRAPAATPIPATPKQRNYIAALQDEIGWHSEQMAVYAKEQRIDLVSMTTAEASAFIEGMKRLAKQELPF